MSRGRWWAAKAPWSPCCTRRSILVNHPAAAGRWWCSATPTSPEAADLVPLVVKHDPLAVEGLDDTLISLEREEHLRRGALDKLPEGSGWLMIQFGGDKQGGRRSQGARASSRGCGRTATTRNRMSPTWKTRRSRTNTGTSGRLASGPPPTRRASTRRTRAGRTRRSRPSVSATTCGISATLLRRYDYEPASLYGHFGHGCVHTRIPFELRTKQGAAQVPVVRGGTAADLVVSYGGSLSGERGDGQARASCPEDVR